MKSQDFQVIKTCYLLLYHLNCLQIKKSTSFWKLRSSYAHFQKRHWLCVILILFLAFYILALSIQQKSFFPWRKNNISFSRYLLFVFLINLETFKPATTLLHVPACCVVPKWNLVTYWCFLSQAGPYLDLLCILQSLTPFVKMMQSKALFWCITLRKGIEQEAVKFLVPFFFSLKKYPFQPISDAALIL